ncbi:hypothetical protein P9112_003364 [Eukaryota sp. TZLM1-RC]
MDPDNIANTGVIYFPSLSPHLTPNIVRKLMSRFGEVDRIFLRPDPSSTKKRKQRFIDGWVEFKDKRIARAVAEMLNGNPIGGESKTKTPYYYDMWSIRYLPKFKWHHLTERSVYQKAVRQQRLQTEIRQAKRENETLLQSIDQSKMLKEKAEKAKKKAKETNNDEVEAQSKVYNKSNIHRDFHQAKPASMGNLGTRKSGEMDNVLNLLTKKSRSD